MLDHEGFLAAFRVPGQRAVSEAAAPGLIHGVHDTARRPEPERADPQAKDQHGARLAVGEDAATWSPARSCTCHWCRAFPALAKMW